MSFHLLLKVCFMFLSYFILDSPNFWWVAYFFFFLKISSNNTNLCILGKDKIFSICLTFLNLEVGGLSLWIFGWENEKNFYVCYSISFGLNYGISFPQYLLQPLSKQWVLLHDFSPLPPPFVPLLGHTNCDYWFIWHSRRLCHLASFEIFSLRLC